MQVIEIDHRQIPSLSPSVCCVGYFDGFHLGHQLLLKETLERAAQRHEPAGVILFDPDPWTLFHPDVEMDHLTPLKKRIEMIEAKGFDRVYILRFTKEFAALSSAGFHQVLHTMHVSELICGTDFHYGKNNSGSVETLKEQSYFQVDALSPLMENEYGKISSSTIEKYIEEGKIEEANKLLGYMYSIDGTIVHGFQRGSSLLQIPTANLEWDELFVLPAIGVYTGFVKVDGSYYPAMINVGYNPTFKNKKKTIEANLFDFDQDLYGKRTSFLFVARLRGEKKFDSIDQLKEQLLHDRERSKRLLANISIQDWSTE